MSSVAVKSLYVKDLLQLPGDRTIAEELFAVADMEIKEARTGASFLSLTLVDRTGSLPGLIFDCDAIPTGYKIGDAVLVWGAFNRRFNNINLQQVSQYGGPIDSDCFLPTCPKDIETMYKELLDIMATISNSHLLNLLGAIFLDEQVSDKFRKWPAAQEVHHAYIGGLLEHSLTVAKLCQQTSDFYEVDRDLLVVGSLLHDIGKLQELDCGLTVAYTDIGRLRGHSLLGSLFVRDKILGIKDFPEQLSHEILHIIESHHGKREWGATVAPMTLEAFLVFILDYADFKASRYEAKISEQRPLEQSISPRDFFLETAVYAPRIEEEL